MKQYIIVGMLFAGSTTIQSKNRDTTQQTTTFSLQKLPLIHWEHKQDIWVKVKKACSITLPKGNLLEFTNKGDCFSGELVITNKANQTTYISSSTLLYDLNPYFNNKKDILECTLYARFGPDGKAAQMLKQYKFTVQR